MTLTFDDIANNPQAHTRPLTHSAGVFVVRPLENTPDDVQKLTKFLQGLSTETRRLSTFDSYDKTMAQTLCDAIAKYDKLRFVVEHEKRIIGLLEYSFAITPHDKERYAQAGITLDAKTDVRWGPTLADDFQDKGLGSLLMPTVKAIAKQFGKKRMILWGGVLDDNPRAIHFYKKHGFVYVGYFDSGEGRTSLDMIATLTDPNAK